MAIAPETKVPSIPNPASDPDGFMQAVTEILQVREGVRGNSLDRTVTFRDLVDAGLAAPNPALSGRGRLPASSMILPSGAGGIGGAYGTGVRPSLTVPPRPRDVVAVGTFTTVLIAWAQPDYANHSLTEILRADTDDIGQAVIIGSSVGGQYTDAVGTSADKYYWVRFVSQQNVKGPASASAHGKTALDPQYVMANLLAQTWQPNTAYGLFQYVKPTVDNGFMYRVSMDGISGATEPDWPTVVGQTKTDGTAQWTTVATDERIPFVIGTVNGEPAVVMDTAYIGDATITVAKIKEAFLDNLTAIHGTLTFARIEQGVIFELAIGGEIKSSTFSPLYNTGFIIRNEPGRDPDTPTLREYTAEFYGDTLFSGDVRAARILGGVIVGNILAVPSDADNGSFEFIAVREIVADANLVERADSYATRAVSVIGFPDSNLIPRADIVTIYVDALQWSMFGFFGPNDYNRYPISATNGQTVTFDRERYESVVVGKGSAVYPVMYFSPNVIYNYNSMTAAQKYTAVFAPMLANTISADQARFCLPGAFLPAQITSNPLDIISSSAIAPFNYNRYRHNNVSCMIQFNRTSKRHINPFGGWAMDSEWTDREKLFAQFGSIDFCICKGTTGEVLRRVRFGEFPAASLAVSATDHVWHVGSVTYVNIAVAGGLTYSDSKIEVSIATNTSITEVQNGRNFRNLNFVAGSFFIAKDIEFLHSVPEGLVLMIESKFYDEGILQDGAPRGLDIGVTFSSVMDNNV